MISISHQDLLCFAKLSGDFNPIHLEPEYSKNSMFGEQIVHGIYIVLLAINKCVSVDGIAHMALTRLSVKFPKPTLLKKEIAFVTSKISTHSYKVIVIQEGVTTTVINLSFSNDYGDVSDVKLGCAETETLPIVDYQRFIGKQIKLCLHFDAMLFRNLFSQRLMQVIPSCQLAEIISTSVCVGMYAPGLNSLYSHLYLEWSLKGIDGCAEKTINFMPQSVDLRFKKMDIIVNNERVSGQISAFVRPSVDQCFDNEFMESVIEKNAMQTERALVLGGSSGIGLGVVRCLLHGGANVLATFRSEQSDLEELSKCFENRLQTLQFELNEIGIKSENFIQFQPTQLYYFITPRIFAPQQESSSFSRLQLLIDTYCTKVLEILSVLEPAVTNLKVFLPSSSAISEERFNQRDYVCAKMLQESLVAHIIAEHTKLEVYCPRLPRYATRQTLSVSPVDTKPVHHIAEYVKIFQTGDWYG